jgi:hypothetical protein
MATAHKPMTGEARPSYVPPIGADELLRRNRAAMALLDRWEAESDEDEQRDTMEALRDALGEGRSLSSRPLFP